MLLVWYTIRSCIQSYVYHGLYMYSQVITVSHNTLWTVHYYLLYQRTPIVTYNRCIPCSPITRVNQGPKLLKLIGWRYCPCFRSVPYIPGTTASNAWRWTSRTTRYYSNSNLTIGTITVLMRCQSSHRNPAAEPSVGCVTYILSPPKIQTLSPPSIFPIPV